MVKIDEFLNSWEPSGFRSPNSGYSQTQITRHARQTISKRAKGQKYRKRTVPNSPRRREKHTKEEDQSKAKSTEVIETLLAPNPPMRFTNDWTSHLFLMVFFQIQLQRLCNSLRRITLPDDLTSTWSSSGTFTPGHHF